MKLILVMAAMLIFISGYCQAEDNMCSYKTYQIYSSGDLVSCTRYPDCTVICQ